MTDKFTIEQLKSYLIASLTPKGYTELDIQRAIAEVLECYQDSEGAKSLIAASIPFLRCAGCRVDFSKEKMESYMAMMKTGEPERFKSFDFHCERCARAEVLRREVLTGPPGNLYVLSGFDIDILSKTSFELGASLNDMEFKEKHFQRVLGATLLRKVEMDKLTIVPPNPPERH